MGVSLSLSQLLLRMCGACGEFEIEANFDVLSEQMFANNCNKAIRCCVWQTSKRRSFIANKLSTIIDRLACCWLMWPTPREGHGICLWQEKRKWTPCASPCDTSHCIVTRFGPLIDIDLVWSAKRVWLELIVIVERKAHINMQQTKRGVG